MNIIWITLESILPANSGGRLGVFKRLEQVAKTENIYLFYPYDNQSEFDRAEMLREYCIQVYPYYRGQNTWSALWQLYKYPYTVASRNIAAMRNDIEVCLSNNQIDLINVDFPHMCAVLLGLDISVPIVLNEHNVEWEVYKTIASSQKNFLKKTAYWVDSWRLKKYEKKVFDLLQINMITFVSERDMQVMQRNICKDILCKLVPVGADVQDVHTVISHTDKRIIFVGKMSYGPNIEAVKWFVKSVLPLIKEKVKNVKFFIVGKDASKDVVDLAAEDVIVTGMVDSVSEYYNQADLVVLPLFNGGGVKVKLLEAVSYKKAIVSTSVGVEGTIYADGMSIPVANDSKNFASLCIHSLINRETIELQIERAYKIFKEHYMWEKIGFQYKEYLRSVVDI